MIRRGNRDISWTQLIELGWRRRSPSFPDHKHELICVSLTCKPDSSIPKMNLWVMLSIIAFVLSCTYSWSKRVREFGRQNTLDHIIQVPDVVLHFTTFLLNRKSFPAFLHPNDLKAVVVCEKEVRRNPFGSGTQCCVAWAYATEKNASQWCSFALLSWSGDPFLWGEREEEKEKKKKSN